MHPNRICRCQLESQPTLWATSTFVVSVASEVKSCEGTMSDSIDHVTASSCMQLLCFWYKKLQHVSSNDERLAVSVSAFFRPASSSYTFVSRYTCASSPARLNIFSGLVFSALKIAMQCFQKGSWPSNQYIQDMYLHIVGHESCVYTTTVYSHTQPTIHTANELVTRIEHM